MVAVEQFYVPNIMCEHCVKAINDEVAAVAGVHRVQINMADKSVRVEHDGSTTISDLIEAINEAGYFEVSVLA